MPKIADLVYEYTATTGTGPFTLAGARSTDFRTFAQAHSVGDTVYYSIRGGGQWEVGIGTLTSSNVLTRTTVTNGSAGPGVAVNFAAGNKDIYETPHSGAYVGIDELPTTSTFDDTDKLIVLKANGTVSSILASIVKAAGTGGGATDTTAPTYSSGQVTNAVKTDIVLTFNETLAAFTPSASAFAVSGGKTVSSVARSGSTVTLTVNSAYAYGDTITVTYTKPGTNPLQDAAGNQVASFGPVTVTNNISNPGDVTAPTASSAAVANATPTYVDITMSEAMDTAYTPAASSITVNGHTVSAVAWLSSTVLRVTVTTAFINGEPARTTTYTQPGTNNARDLAGNLLANFTGLAITNNVAASDPSVLTAANWTVANPHADFGEQYAATLGGNPYWTVGMHVSVKQVANPTVYPADNVLTAFWTRVAAGAAAPSTLPTAQQFSGGAWPTSVTNASNGGSTGTVPNSVKLLVNFANASYPDAYRSDSQLYGGPITGDYYLVVGFPDGTWKLRPGKVVVTA